MYSTFTKSASKKEIEPELQVSRAYLNLLILKFTTSVFSMPAFSMSLIKL